MIENERFKLVYLGEDCWEHEWDIEDTANPNTIIPQHGKTIVGLMNELNDENEQLKSEYKVLYSQYQDLKKFVENNFDEHLTQKELNRQIIKLSNENEELKKENATLKGRVLNAIRESEKVKCDCRECVCAKFVIGELME